MRAAFFSRLALALLAVLGVVAPAAERQVDEQVQTSRVASRRVVAVPEASRARTASGPRAPDAGDEPGPEASPALRRRYLEQHAWLI